MWVSGWLAIRINPRAPCCYDKNVKVGFFIAVLAASAALAQERATAGATGAEGGRGTALQADTETPSPAGASAAETATRPATREAPATPAGPDEAPTAFDPTEEVSEDYSIEFPVDI